MECQYSNAYALNRSNTKCCLSKCWVKLIPGKVQSLKISWCLEILFKSYRDWDHWQFWVYWGSHPRPRVDLQRNVSFYKDGGNEFLCRVKWHVIDHRFASNFNMMMIAFITFNSSLVPFIEGLCSSNLWEFEFSGSESVSILSPVKTRFTYGPTIVAIAQGSFAWRQIWRRDYFVLYIEHLLERKEPLWIPRPQYIWFGI